MSIELGQGDTTLAMDLNRIPVERFDRIVLMATDRYEDVQVSDARTVMTYIRLRDRLRQSARRTKVVIEVIDPVNKRLFGSSLGEEVIVSNEVVSHLLAQIALRPDLNDIFNNLLIAGGPEFFFHPATRHFAEGERVSFDQIAARALAGHETAIGVEIDGKVLLAPARATTWRVDDQLTIIVISEYPEQEAYAATGSRDS